MFTFNFSENFVKDKSRIKKIPVQVKKKKCIIVI